MDEWKRRNDRLDADLASGKMSQDLYYLEKRKLEEGEARDDAMVKLIKKVGIGAGALVVVIIALVWSAQASAPKDDGKMSESEIQSSVTSICQKAVTDSLKSPGTAEFGDVSIRTGSGSIAYVITGAVDSENSFGGTVRSDFICQSERFEGGGLLTTLTEITERH